MPVAQKTSRQNKTKSKRKPTTIMVGARPQSASSSRASTKRSRSTQPAAPKKTRTRKSGKDHATLPSWKQLESKKNRRLKQDRGSSLFLDAVSTVRFALILAAVATAFTVYVGHVHATHDILAKTEAARKENHQLHLKYNRLKGEFDRMTGPAEIHRRANALGLVEDAAYRATVTLNP
jgi:cell division protein FtsL